jgi:hypothetical protein
MKKLTFIFCALLASGSGTFAAERTILARVTGYWPAGRDNARGCGTGAVLHNGHCAVDPKYIPYRSKVIFPDAICEAVDSGPAVVSRKSARSCGRTKEQRAALVVDRFFESKAEAVRWSNSHPQFMSLRVIPPGEASAMVQTQTTTSTTTSVMARAEGPAMAPNVAMTETETTTQTTRTSSPADRPAGGVALPNKFLQRNPRRRG